MKKLDSEKLGTFFCLGIAVCSLFLLAYILEGGPAVSPPAVFTYADAGNTAPAPASSEPAAPESAGLESAASSEPVEMPAVETPAPSRPAVLPPAEGEKRYPSPESSASSSGPVSSREEVPQKKPSESSEPDVPAEPSAPSLVNLNTAAEAELCTLDGIGPVLAARIIEFREACGGFSSIEELMSVSGIGEKKFAAIRDKIIV